MRRRSVHPERWRPPPRSTGIPARDAGQARTKGECKVIDLRCSSLPRILSCPASRHAPAIDVQGDDDAARLGSAVHVAAELHVKSVAITGDAYTDLAAAWKVDVEELRILSNMARQCWEHPKIKDNFPAPQTEQSFEVISSDGIRLT